MERLHALAALTDRWERFCAAASPDLPEGLKRVVDRATEAVRAVRDAVARELGRDGRGTTGGGRE